MPDLDYDDDAMFEEQQMQLDIEIHRIQSNIEPPPTRCKFCDDPLPPNHGSFCDEGCRELYDREQHNKRVRGLL